MCLVFLFINGSMRTKLVRRAHAHKLMQIFLALCCPVAGRTNGSMCWCVAEAVLSTIVFVYALKGAVEIVQNQDVARGCFLFPPVVLCIGCAVWTGVSHSLLAPRVQVAVNNIVSANAIEINRLGPVAWADTLSLDGVDLFSYHDVLSLSLNVLKVVSAWLLLQVLSLGLTLCVVVYLLLAFTFAVDAYWLLAVFVPLWLGTYARLMYKYGIVGRTWKLGEACRTQPFHPHVRPMLLVSSLVYAVLLYLSPVPAAWYWSLIATHTARALLILISLRWQSERAAEGGVVAGDLLYDVPIADGGAS